ncbi:tRNA (adenosine(37)-N6)-threonylcarbamoyltransferase complex ATPase subunit type 1 TsaE [Cognatiluteimonas profundi]|uniref:tRNA (adenosine(37)-N6)-threonylcarbamoyltransferase complex ATPase subunit type 1 TsaE n=1 Tax=Cognatiluteimonas profundi TaxID=2594501 RepID=UPI00131AFE19|nr:tRNA (adenosine(37)-N6)-threonylcarbamoyltransferase complex ATPase subunit type 1 TsaE [Lysobacter profundi]
MTTFHLRDARATDALGGLLSRTQPDRAIVYLHGDLGAGKSTLARAWLRELGVTGAIRSPTYTLVEHYPLDGDRMALHLDLYRIGAPGELEFLALDDANASLWLVEWPERGGHALPEADLHVFLELAGEGRQAELREGSPVGAAWLERVEENGVCEPFLPPDDRNTPQPTDK